MIPWWVCALAAFLAAIVGALIGRGIDRRLDPHLRANRAAEKAVGRGGWPDDLPYRSGSYERNRKGSRKR